MDNTRRESLSFTSSIANQRARRTSYEVSFNPKIPEMQKNRSRRTSSKIISRQAVNEFIEECESLCVEWNEKLNLDSVKKFIQKRKARNAGSILSKKSNGVHKLRSFFKLHEKKEKEQEITPIPLKRTTPLKKIIGVDNYITNPMFYKSQLQKCHSFDNLKQESVSPVQKQKQALNERVEKLKKSISSTNLRRTESVPLMPATQIICVDPVIHADLLPPVTRFTLRELSYEKIVNNAQIRHDLLFEPSLEFISNTNAEHTQKKSNQISEYWKSVERDLALLSNIKDATANEDSGSKERLKSAIFSGGTDGNLRIPILINEIKEILLELLPYSSKLSKELKERFDVDFISQQIEFGVFKIEPLIQYLAVLLKQHCAPIRDELIDEMERKCSEGDLISTLKTCFDILELMKLDLANDQLRKIKPHVVQHAFEYEWNHFRQQIDRGKITTNLTTTWLQNEFSNPSKFEDQSPINSPAISRSGSRLNLDQLAKTVAKPEKQSPSMLKSESKMELLKEDALEKRNQLTEKLIKAFLSLVISRPTFKAENTAETFRLDLTRLSKYHTEWQDAVVVGCLLLLYRQQTGPDASKNIAQVKSNLCIILNDSETSMEHVISYLVDMSEKAKGRKITEKEISVFSSLVEKTIGVDNGLFLLMQNRIGSHLFTYLKKEMISEEAMVKHGLLELKDEILALAVKMHKLFTHNLKVYGTLYNEILKNITKK